MDTTGLIAASNSLLNNATQLYSMKQQDELNKWTQEMGEKQFDAQQDWATKMFDYQKEMNNVTMEREDNAVRRRAADLAAAGLNPNLAVGQPASSQGFSGAGSISPTSTNAGKVFNPKFQSLTGAYLDARMRMADIEQVQEQSNLLRKQSKYYDALSGKVDSEKQNVDANTDNVKKRTEQLVFDLGLSKLVRIRTNDTGTYAQGATSVIGSTVDVADLIAGKVVDAVAPSGEQPSKIAEVKDKVAGFIKEGIEADKIRIESLGNSIKDAIGKGWSWLKDKANSFNDFLNETYDK